MMSSNSRLFKACARGAWLIPLSAAITTPTTAQTYRCTNQDTARSYVATQNVPGDKCVFVRKESPYSSTSYLDKGIVVSQREIAEAKRQAKAFAEADAASKVRSDGLALGMTPLLVRKSPWGIPKDVQRITTSGGVSERWLYGGRKVLHFENGVLVAIFE